MNGCGEIALLKVDEQAFAFTAAFAHQTAFKAVETTTDDADLFAIKPGRDLLITEILHIVGLLDGTPKDFKVLVAHTHCLIPLATTHIAVLQQWHPTNDRVELFLRLMHEDEVAHIGDEAHHAPTESPENLLLERHEHAAIQLSHRLQLLVSGFLGVRTCQIAQHIPAIFHNPV